MGKTKLVTLIIRKTNTREYVSSWPTSYLGRPTAQKLAQWRDDFNKSLLKGGCNEHIGTPGWLQCKLEVYNQKTKQVICQYNPPMFEIIP